VLAAPRLGSADRVTRYAPWSVEDARSPLKAKLQPELRGLEDWQRLARDEDWQAAEWTRCELDPWYWLVNYVVTRDERWMEHGYDGPYRRFPAKRHLQSYVYILWRYRSVAFPKARQQYVSWLCDSYILGDAQFTRGRLYMIQSKREADSVMMLRRIRGIYRRQRQLAPWLGPHLVAESATELRFANDAHIMAVPSGPHYVQSHTPSLWLADEAQLQEATGPEGGIAEAYNQALPACERIWLVGSADTGWFWERLLQDKE